MEYILQRKGSCCSLVTLLNALRYWGKDTPSPTDSDPTEWESLVDLAGCRHGSAIMVDRLAAHLGIERHPLRDVKEVCASVPAELTVWNPEEVGSAMHSVLVIGGVWPRLKMVNYHWRKGPVVETVEPMLPDDGNPNRQAWALYSMDDGRVTCKVCGGRYKLKKNGLPRGHAGPDGSYCRSPR